MLEHIFINGNLDVMKRLSLMFIVVIGITMMMSSCGSKAKKELAEVKQELSEEKGQNLEVIAKYNQLVKDKKAVDAEVKLAKETIAGNQVNDEAELKKLQGQKWYWKNETKKSKAEFEQYAKEETAKKETLSDSVRQLKQDLDASERNRELVDTAYAILEKKFSVTQKHLVAYEKFVNKLAPTEKQVVLSVDSTKWIYTGDFSGWQNFWGKEDVESVCVERYVVGEK